MVNAHATASRFQTTSWTLIVRARASRADLQELLSVYWSPVYAYLRRRGHDPHDAADLTQGFLSEVVLDRGFVERADPARGRFRSFLLSALRKFVIDEHRRVRRGGLSAPVLAQRPNGGRGEINPATTPRRLGLAELQVTSNFDQCALDGERGCLQVDVAPLKSE